MAIEDVYTTQEVGAILGLTVKSVLKRALRESWQSRPRAGRGGGNVWLTASMPDRTRLAILAQLAPVEPVLSTENDERLPPSAERRAAARAAVVQVFTVWAATHPARPRAQADRFAGLWGKGEIPAQGWVREALPEFCGVSLLNWCKRIKAKGTTALAGNYGNRRLGGRIDGNPEVRKTILGLLHQWPHMQAGHIHEALALRFPPEQTPSLRRVQDWLRTWKNDNRQFYQELVNPDAWRSRYMMALGDMSAAVFRMNQRWEMDGTPWDVQTSDGKRHSITGLIDVFTRSAQLFSTQTTSAMAVASTLRRGIDDFGVPESVVTDNGHDYIAAHIIRIMVDLDIYQDICPPFSPWKKPYIEQFFHTFSHDLLEYEDGYIGHNVAERQAIREREAFSKRLFSKEGRDITLCVGMDSAALQQYLDDWLKRYHHRPHSGLGGRTPWDVRQECLARQKIRRVTNPRALDILLLPMAAGQAGWRTVGKKGVRAGMPGHYIAPELGPLAGQRVQVRLDGTDLSVAYLFDEAGAFVCKAYNSDMYGVSMADAAEARRLQKAANRARREELALAARDTRAADIPTEILAADVARARRIEAQSVAENAARHTSHALTEAARASVNIHKSTLTAEQAVDLRRRAATAMADTGFHAPDTATARYQLCEETRARIAQGEDVPASLRNWTYNYQTSTEYVGQQAMADLFGTKTAAALAG